jgi:hypothetical protein
MRMIDAKSRSVIRCLIIGQIALAAFMVVNADRMAVADCQDACLQGCPKHPAALGATELDRTCVEHCLELQCSVSESNTSPPLGNDLIGRDRIQTVEIWIRSFIPINHDSNPGYTLPVPTKPTQTMIRDPIPLFTGCYLTDQRRFSNDPNGSVRLGTHVAISAGAVSIITLSENPPSESVEVNCETGAERCRKRVDTSRSNAGPITQQGDILRLRVHGEANNACFTGSPDIHYDGEFIIDLAVGTIKFRGTIGRFPAFESYARVDKGPIRTIFQEPPVPGSTVLQVPLTRIVDTPDVKF